MEPYTLRYVLELNDRVARGLVWRHYEGRKTARMSIYPSKPTGNARLGPPHASTTRTPGFNTGERSSVTRELMPGLPTYPVLLSDSPSHSDLTTSSTSSGRVRARATARMTVRWVNNASRNLLLVSPTTESSEKPTAVIFGRRRAVVKRSTRGEPRREAAGATETVDLTSTDGCLCRWKRRREEDESGASPCVKRHLADVDYVASDVDYDADDESC